MIQTTARLWNSKPYCCAFRVTLTLAVIAWGLVLYDVLCDGVSAPTQAFNLLVGVATSASLAVSVTCALHSYEQILRHVARTSYAQGREDRHRLHVVKSVD